MAEKRRRPRTRRGFDRITAKRRALFEAGGIRLEAYTDDGGRRRGRMVPDSPEFQARADEYNRLADIHGPEP